MFDNKKITSDSNFDLWIYLMTNSIYKKILNMEFPNKYQIIIDQNDYVSNFASFSQR